MKPEIKKALFDMGIYFKVVEVMKTNHIKDVAAAMALVYLIQ